MSHQPNIPIRRWARGCVPTQVLVGVALLGPALLLWGGGQQVGGQPAQAGQPEARQEGEQRGGDNERRDRGGPPWRQNFDADDLTDEQIETMLLIVEAMFPDRIDQFRKLRETDNRKFRRLLEGIAESNGEVPWLVRMRRWDTEMFDLHVAHLGAKYRVFEVDKNLRRQLEPAPADRDEQKIAQLKEQGKTAIRFKKETEFKIRQLMLDRWEQRLREFKTALDSDKSNLDTAVDTELAEMVRRAEAGEPAQRPEDANEGLFDPRGPGGPQPGAGPGPRDGQNRRGDGNRND